MRVAMLGLVSLTLGLGGTIALADTPNRRDATRQDARSDNTPQVAAPVVLRHTSFDIPFTVNSDGTMPVEVRLFVSTDRGATWRLYERARPQSGEFAFRADRDGEYWFALKTIHGRQQSAARNDDLVPGLRVVVDSTEPQLDFQAHIGAAGEVVTSWSIADSTLNAESFKVEYQAENGGAWRTVAINRQAASSADGGVTGKMTWWPETASRAINIRAEVSDQAANKTVVNRRLVVPRVAANQQGGEAITMTDVPPDPYVSPAESTGNGVPWLPDEQRGSSSAATASNRSPNWESSPSGPDRSRSIARHSESSKVDRSGSFRSVPPVAEKREDVDEKEIDNPHFAEDDSFSELGQFPPVAGDVRPPVSGVSTTTEGGADTNVPPDPYAQNTKLPDGERPRMTSAMQFALEYDVASVGPAGIAEVQLWGTQNGGRSWELWSKDNDKRSPVDVSVQGEGVYGFRVVVVGNNGLSGKKPAAGDLADLWIGVDETTPTVRLTSAIYGEGRFAGQLDIRWTASDESFSDRPITIQFSGGPQGPWSTIASGIPNTGQFHWSVEPRIPQKVYLRIEARDLAGNVGDYQLAQPVNTTGLTPRGHIRGFRPTSQPLGANSRWKLFK